MEVTFTLNRRTQEWELRDDDGLTVVMILSHAAATENDLKFWAHFAATHRRRNDARPG